MDTVKISWSGGKDSTASVLLHLNRGDFCKIVCYIPMLDNDIPLIYREHYDFIMKSAGIFRKLGAEVYIVHGITFENFVHKIATRGKYKGLYFGAALCYKMQPGTCSFRRDSKVKAIKSCDCGSYDYEDIGIAYDETARHSQLVGDLRSILVELGFTEADAKSYCIYHKMLSPLYDMQTRDGCVICPFAKSESLKHWASGWGDGALLKLFEIEKFCRENRPDRVPLRNMKWWSDL